MFLPAGNFKKIVDFSEQSELKSYIDSLAQSNYNGYIKILFVEEETGRKGEGYLLFNKGKIVASQLRLGEEQFFKNDAHEMILSTRSGIIELYELSEEDLNRAMALNPQALFDESKATEVEAKADEKSAREELLAKLGIAEPDEEEIIKFLEEQGLGHLVKKRKKVI